ncbi:Exopolygalacturonase-like protein [Drosera capensis]
MIKRFAMVPVWLLLHSNVPTTTERRNLFRGGRISKRKTMVANDLMRKVLVLTLLAFVSRSHSAILDGLRHYLGGNFYVNDHGAKCDGKTDDSEVIMKMWNLACSSDLPSGVVLSYGTYMAGPLKFEGPLNIDRLTVTGGTLDCKGEHAWKELDCADTGACHSLPVNIQFTNVTNAVVRNITSVDGKGINITNADIQTGTNCVSIDVDSQQINTEKVICGLGKGINVGGLGSFEDEGSVVGITVRNCTTNNTTGGVAVTSWPDLSGAGFASDIRFEDIIMNNVTTHLLIDQEYCPYDHCVAKVSYKVLSRFKISSLVFKNIRGTSASKVAVKLDCSSIMPRQDVKLEDIDLKYNGKEGSAVSEIANVKPAVQGKMLLRVGHRRGFFRPSLL